MTQPHISQTNFQELLMAKNQAPSLFITTVPIIITILQTENPKHCTDK
jgi:hypothetical protein